MPSGPGQEPQSKELRSALLGYFRWRWARQLLVHTLAVAGAPFWMTLATRLHRSLPLVGVWLFVALMAVGAAVEEWTHKQRVVREAPGLLSARRSPFKWW